MPPAPSPGPGEGVGAGVSGVVGSGVDPSSAPGQERGSWTARRTAWSTATGSGPASGRSPGPARGAGRRRRRVLGARGALAADRRPDPSTPRTASARGLPMTSSTTRTTPMTATNSASAVTVSTRPRPYRSTSRSQRFGPPAGRPPRPPGPPRRRSRPTRRRWPPPSRRCPPARPARPPRGDRRDRGRGAGACGARARRGLHDLADDGHELLARLLDRARVDVVRDDGQGARDAGADDGPGGPEVGQSTVVLTAASALAMTWVSERRAGPRAPSRAPAPRWCVRGVPASGPGSSRGTRVASRSRRGCRRAWSRGAGFRSSDGLVRPPPPAVTAARQGPASGHGRPSTVGRPCGPRSRGRARSSEDPEDPVTPPVTVPDAGPVGSRGAPPRRTAGRAVSCRGPSWSIRPRAASRDVMRTTFPPPATRGPDARNSALLVDARPGRSQAIPRLVR